QICRLALSVEEELICSPAGNSDILQTLQQRLQIVLVYLLAVLRCIQNKPEKIPGVTVVDVSLVTSSELGPKHDFTGPALLIHHLSNDIAHRACSCAPYFQCKFYHFYFSSCFYI